MTAEHDRLSVHPIRDDDREWVLHIVQRWGADFIVSRGRTIYPSRIDGFFATNNTGDRVGLVTFEIIGDQCEIVTLDAFIRFRGIGTQLLNAVVDHARDAGCRRVWLITTNDNVDALRFYQKRGFVLVAVHRGAIDESRRIKPSIARIGEYGIPIRDEVECELVLAGEEPDQ
ncbi:MAG: GNAT family N-acetyltransferase [candidate division Zixibacteria bacterium]|nr:GNAT family N-acetyltransferase [candidate division Zixibacteria bacterium]